MVECRMTEEEQKIAARRALALVGRRMLAALKNRREKEAEREAQEATQPRAD